MMYGVLGGTYLNAATLGFSKVTQVRLGSAWLLTVLYGASDEFHQWFVPGRFCDFQDWLADGVGASLVIGGWVLYQRIRKGNSFKETKRI